MNTKIDTINIIKVIEQVILYILSSLSLSLVGLNGWCKGFKGYKINTLPSDMTMVKAPVMACIIINTLSIIFLFTEGCPIPLLNRFILGIWESLLHSSCDSID